MSINSHTKIITATLLLSGLFFCEIVLANPGVAVSKTMVLDKTQFPAVLKKQNPSNVYVLYYGTPFLSKYEGAFLRSDTITNFKKFSDSLSKSIGGYRLIYETKGRVDSVWQFNKDFVLTDKAYNLGGDLLRVVALDNKGNVADEFIYNFMKKFNFSKEVATTQVLPLLLREYEVYSSYDRNNYSVNAVWCLSIGINRYNEPGMPDPGKNCESDARSYNDFFKKQFSEASGSKNESTLFNEYLLLGENATKDAILNALKDIAAKASSKDYFIFNFGGTSALLDVDSTTQVTYFFPFDKKGYWKELNRSGIGKKPFSKTQLLDEQLISLNILQEYILQIPAVNQLFISEAGPSEKFKTEFIRTLMQNSPAVASLLNKNRVIIVPNGYGLDDITCEGQRKGKGPINYFITSLDSGVNIYDLFAVRYLQIFHYTPAEIVFRKKYRNNYWKRICRYTLCF